MKRSAILWYIVFSVVGLAFSSRRFCTTPGKPLPNQCWSFRAFESRSYCWIGGLRQPRLRFWIGKQSIHPRNCIVNPMSIPPQPNGECHRNQVEVSKSEEPGKKFSISGLFSPNGAEID